MRLALTCLALAGVALVGCSKKGADASAPAASGAAAPAAASAPAGPLGPIAMTDLPAPKAGLWQEVSTQDGGAPTTSDVCMSGKPMDPGKDGPPCPSMTASRTAAGYVVEGTCPNNGVTAKMHLTISGDPQSAFTTDGEMSMTGGPGGDLNMKNHTAYTYKAAACPPGTPGKS